MFVLWNWFYLFNFPWACSKWLAASLTPITSWKCPHPALAQQSISCQTVCSVSDGLAVIQCHSLPAALEVLWPSLTEESLKTTPTGRSTGTLGLVVIQLSSESCQSSWMAEPQQVTQDRRHGTGSSESFFIPGALRDWKTPGLRGAEFYRGLRGYKYGLIGKWIEEWANQERDPKCINWEGGKPGTKGRANRVQGINILQQRLTGLFNFGPHNSERSLPVRLPMGRTTVVWNSIRTICSPWENRLLYYYSAQGPPQSQAHIRVCGALLWSLTTRHDRDLLEVAAHLPSSVFCAGCCCAVYISCFSCFS